MPKFSILLPTRNRSAILSEAIQSVLNQSYRDFELIIADNDDVPKENDSLHVETSTKQVVDNFKDFRIRYLRTGGISMYKNWSYATKHARGEYVLIIEDKQQLMPNCLEVLSSFTEQYPIIVYTISLSKQVIQKQGPLNYTLLTSKYIFKLFGDFHKKGLAFLPKGFNSCVSHKLIEQIQKEHPEGLSFSYLVPDYSFGFRLLNNVENFLYIKTPLSSIKSVIKYSTGGLIKKRDPQTVQEYWVTLPITPQQFERDLPFPSRYSITNFITWDLMRWSPKSTQQIDWMKYFACNFMELLTCKPYLNKEVLLDVKLLFKSMSHYSFFDKVRFGGSFLVRFLDSVLSKFKKMYIGFFQKN